MRVPQQNSDETVADRRKPTLSLPLCVVAALCLALAGVGAAMTEAEPDGKRSAHSEPAEGTHRLLAARPAPHRVSGRSATAAIAEPTRFSVKIRKPPGPPRVATELIDASGREVTVACSTCHTTRPPNRQNKSVKDLDEFHGGMPFSHGTVSCLSCHNEGDYDALRLADGSRIEFSEVMTLCAQCHGPQMKAYEHGAHGGMTGYWDLSRGPRVKNNCIDCHNPHTPQFPKMRPTFKPKDRFLDPTRTKH